MESMACSIVTCAGAFSASSRPCSGRGMLSIPPSIGALHHATQQRAIPQYLLRISAKRAAAWRCQTSKTTTRAAAGGGDGGSGGVSGGGGGGGGSGGGDGGGESEGTGASSVGLAALWNEYLRLLDTYPLPTKAFTSLLLNAFGDTICQLFVEKRSSLDTKRLAVTCTLGFFLVGPTLHFWYSALSRIVTAGGTTGTLMRLALDQFVFSPVFIATFFAALLTLEGRPQDIGAKIRQDLKPAIITNWKLWIPFQFFNFRYVPLRLQVAASNVCAVVWTAYLSMASHKAID